MAICLFCLHEKERFLLSHPEGTKRHLEKQRLKGSQKEFIHSLLLQILWHSPGRSLLQPGSCLCPCACLAQPNPGFALEPPGGASRESRLLPASAAQGWPSPSTSPIPPLPKGTCPDTFALNRVAFKSLGLPTHVKVRLEAKKKQGKLQCGGKGEPGSEPRARCLHPVVVRKGAEEFIPTSHPALQARTEHPWVGDPSRGCWLHQPGARCQNLHWG